MEIFCVSNIFSCFKYFFVNKNVFSPPVICGINSGQHMFLDVTDKCVDISVHINTLDTTTTRRWSMHVLQYEHGDTLAGPTGCLQYHTGLSGYLASFNFDLTATTSAILATTTHLANQVQPCLQTHSPLDN